MAMTLSSEDTVGSPGVLIVTALPVYLVYERPRHRPVLVRLGTELGGWWCYKCRDGSCSYIIPFVSIHSLTARTVNCSHNGGMGDHV